MNGKHGGLGLLAEISLRLQNNSEYLSSNGSSMSLPTLTSYFNNSNDIDSLMVNSPSITPEVQCFSPTNMTVSTAHSIAHENDFLSPSDTTDSSSILWVNLKGQQEIQKNKNISEKLSPTGMIRTHGNLDMGSPSTSSKRNRKKCSEIVREFKCVRNNTFF